MSLEYYRSYAWVLVMASESVVDDVVRMLKLLARTFLL